MLHRMLHMARTNNLAFGSYQGVFWDADGGCLSGDWRGGVLAGAARYTRAALTLAGDFVGGLPRGGVRFVRRMADAHGGAPIAAAHLLAGGAVTLAHGGRYAWPAGDLGQGSVA